MPFYKYQDAAVLLEGDDVEGIGYSLHEATKNLYSYPIDGWYYFSNITEARALFNIPEPQPEDPNELLTPLPVQSPFRV